MGDRKSAPRGAITTGQHKTVWSGGSGEVQSGSSSFSRAGPMISLLPVARNLNVRSTTRRLDTESDLRVLRPGLSANRPATNLRAPLPENLIPADPRARSGRTARLWLHLARTSNWCGKLLQVTNSAGATGFSCPPCIRPHKARLKTEDSPENWTNIGI